MNVLIVCSILLLFGFNLRRWGFNFKHWLVGVSTAGRSELAQDEEEDYARWLEKIWGKRYKDESSKSQGAWPFKPSDKNIYWGCISEKEESSNVTKIKNTPKPR
jgi:hypothetical protein